MSDTPYIPFYTSDFLAGTSGMTAATKGVYITLLSLIYEVEGPLHQSWDTLARRCGCTLPAFEKAVDTLADDRKIVVLDGGIWSEKCEKHIMQRCERRNSAKAAANKRWEKSKQKQGGVDATALTAQCQPEPEPDTLTNVSDGKPSPVKALPMDVSVTATALWAAGTRYFLGQGFTEKQSRSMIGMFLKKHKPEEVLGAIEAARKSGTMDPVPYITNALKPEQTAAQKQKAKWDEEQENIRINRLYKDMKQDEPDLTVKEFRRRTGY